MSIRPSSKPLPGHPGEAENGWLVCPECSATYGKPQHFCHSCHYFSPNRWISPTTTGTRPRWRLRLLILALFFLLLGYLTWLCRPFIPNPLVLFHSPVSQLSALSGPNEWAGYAHDPGHTRYLSPASPLNGRIRWSVDLGESTNSAPAVKEGILYVGGFFKIHALDAATGNRIWETGTTGPVHSSPAIADDLVFLGLLDGGIVALEHSTGKLRWEFRTQNYVFSSPTVFNGILYTGSGDRAIYALDARTGRLIWRTRTDGLILYAPAVKDNILYAPSGDRMLYSLSARTGALRLCFRMYWNFLGSPVVANNLVYFVNNDGRLYTIRHGAREYPGQYKMLLTWAQFWLWKLPVPPPPRQAGSAWRASPKSRKKGFISSPAVTPEALYIGDQQGWFYARDALKGKPLWEFKAGGAIPTSPLVLGDAVCFGSNDGNLYALNRHDGEFLWKVSLESPIKVSPIYASGFLFVRTEDGKLHAIE